jgi:hypothetical protein
VSELDALETRLTKYLLIGAGDTTDEAVEGNHLAELSRTAVRSLRIMIAVAEQERDVSRAQLAEAVRERDELASFPTVGVTKEMRAEVAALSADRDRLAGECERLREVIDELLYVAGNTECEYWLKGCEVREPQRRGEWCRRCGAIHVARAALKAQP